MKKMSKKIKILITVAYIIAFFFTTNIYLAIQKPIPSAGAAEIILPSRDIKGRTSAAENFDNANTNATKDLRNGMMNDDRNSGDNEIVEQDGVEILRDGQGNVIGWKRKETQEDFPVSLPSRNVKTDENGNTTIEIDDPDSIIFDQKLYEVERLPEIRAVDEVAIELAKAYSQANEAPLPFMASTNGRINFYYGTMNPRIICRPLRLTDIELEPGEQVKNVHISDTARWSVSGAWSGEMENLVTHVILKPQLPDIAANLLIHTDRRTYAIEIISLTTEEYMPFVGFLYPETPKQTAIADSESWENLLKQYNLVNEQQAANAAKTARNNARLADPATIYTDYEIKTTKGKNIAWKPKNVYSAGGKTYIAMPPKMQMTEAPAFFIKQNGKEKLTNYRVEGDIYIIDRLFDIGILQIGKDRVAIYRKTPVAAPEKKPAPEETTPTPVPAPKVSVPAPEITINIDESGINLEAEYQDEVIEVVNETQAPQETKDGAALPPVTEEPKTVPDNSVTVKEAEKPKKKDKKGKANEENIEPVPSSETERDWEKDWDALTEKYGLKNKPKQSEDTETED
jgi:type IV secretion system protein VirB9